MHHTQREDRLTRDLLCGLREPLRDYESCGRVVVATTTSNGVNDGADVLDVDGKLFERPDRIWVPAKRASHVNCAL